MARNLDQALKRPDLWFRPLHCGCLHAMALLRFPCAQIATEVGVQAGALYLYTPDKQTLLFELMHDHMKGLLKAWAEPEPAGSSTQQLEAFVRFHIDYHLERVDAVFISYMELRNLNPENFATIGELRREYEAGWRKF